MNTVSIEEKIGKGIRVQKDGNVYEQLSCSNGLVVRLYKPASEGYSGVLFRPNLEDATEDYEVFKSLTDKLALFSNETIQNSTFDYMRYTGSDGLEKKLKNGWTLRINPMCGKIDITNG